MDIVQKIFTADNLLFMARSAGWSIIIAVCALLAGTVLGILAAAARISKSKILRAISTVYVEFIRGTPMLVQILFWFLGFPVVCKAITGSAVNIDPYAIGIIAMGINSGAYSCELIRSAIMAVDRGQWEAAQALGLSYTGMMRHIILPQAFKRIVPPLVSEFVTLIKDSSLISTIGAVELTQSAKVLGARYYNFIPPLALACVVYLTLTLTISHFGKKIERKLAESD